MKEREKNEVEERRHTAGRTLTLSSDHSGSSDLGSSSPSVSRPRPTELDRADDIQTYGRGAYRYLGLSVRNRFAHRAVQ